MENEYGASLKMRVCPECGKKFIPAPLHAYKIGIHFYCSYSCNNAVYKREEEKNKAKIQAEMKAEIERKKARERARKKREQEKAEKITLVRRTEGGKHVLQYTIDGEFVSGYSSCKDAAKAVGTSVSNLARCARGESRTAAGYVWIYADPDAQKRVGSGRTSVAVLQMNVFDEVIAEHESLKAASKTTGINISSISKCINGKAYQAGGYIWKVKPIEQPKERIILK